jgi:hypothetical protein
LYNKKDSVSFYAYKEQRLGELYQLDYFIIIASLKLDHKDSHNILLIGHSIRIVELRYALLEK